MSKRVVVLAATLLSLGMATTCRPFSGTPATPTPFQPTIVQPTSSTQPQPTGTPTPISTSPTSPGPSPASSVVATPFLPPALILIEPGNAVAIQQIAEIQVSEASFVYHLDFSPDGRIMVAWVQNPSRSWSVELWDLASGQELSVLEEWHGEPKVLVSPTGDFLATILMYVEPTIIWNPASADSLSLLNRDDLYAAFSPDLNLLVRSPSYDPGTEKSIVMIVDTKSGQLMHTIEIDGFLMGTAFSLDGSIVALVEGGSVDVLDTELWDVTTGQHLLTLPRIGELTFSSDGHLAAGLLDIGVWISVFRTEDWEEQIRVGEGMGTDLDNPSFAPNGDILAAVNKHHVMLWSTTTGEELFNVGSFPEEPITNFAFSPDGKLLATCDRDSVKLWGVLP